MVYKTQKQRIESALLSIIEDSSVAIEQRLEATRQLLASKRAKPKTRKRKPKQQAVQTTSVLGSK
jgi:hypothetical protein